MKSKGSCLPSAATDRDARMHDAARATVERCRENRARLAVAESCTGGLIAAAVTSIAGASDVLDRGFVTYSNESKTELLGVNAADIVTHGAVSHATAHQMATGALNRSNAEIAVATTGIAGPGGGSPDKPVGTVYVAGAARGHPVRVEAHLFDGGRDEIRIATVQRALDLVGELAVGKPPPKSISKVIGIDFSAARDGGRACWIAAATQDRSRLTIAKLIPAADLPGSGAGPETFLPALRAFIADCGDAVIGLDFPFGLPRPLVGGAAWRVFLDTFLDNFPNPNALRSYCRDHDGGQELKRRCDREAETPFSPYNLRMYRQTWWGIGHVLAPLVGSGSVRAGPMQPPAAALPTLIEACPASVLKRLGVYQSYKGKAASHRGARVAIMRRLEHERVEIAPDLATTAIDDAGGDALDAILAAVAAWPPAADPKQLEPRQEKDTLEARVYF